MPHCPRCSKAFKSQSCVLQHMNHLASACVLFKDELVNILDDCSEPSPSSSPHHRHPASSPPRVASESLDQTIDDYMVHDGGDTDIDMEAPGSDSAFGPPQ